MVKLKLGLLRKYVDDDTLFRLTDDGIWYGTYKGHEFNFEQNEESMKYYLQYKKKDVDKIGIPKLTSVEMKKISNTISYEFNDEERDYLEELYKECKKTVTQELREHLVKVSYKEKLDHKKLTEIFYNTDKFDIFRGLQEYVSYIVFGLAFKVRVNVLVNLKYKVIKEELNLFDLDEFIRVLELANEYYKKELENNLEEVALNRFNKAIEDYYPELYFPTVGMITKKS